MKTLEPTFEELLHWAKHEPKKLEEYHRVQIEEIINNAPSHIQRRLRGLQFQIDCQRSLHKSAIGRCIQISKMMHESLNELLLVLNGDKVQTNTTSGEVIKFPCAN